MIIIWIFCEDGFTSAVEFMPRTVNRVIKPAVWSYDKETKKSVQTAPAVTEVVEDQYVSRLKDYTPGTKEVLSSHLLVRARVEADLDPLKEIDPDAVSFEDKTADYQFRIILSRKAYATYVYQKIMVLDYDSHVKETIDRRAPEVKGGRYPALSAIWSACNKWQPVPPYGGGYTLGSSDDYKVGGVKDFTGKYGTSYQSATGGGKSYSSSVPNKVGGTAALPKAARGPESMLAGVSTTTATDEGNWPDNWTEDSGWVSGTSGSYSWDTKTAADALDDDNPFSMMEWWQEAIACDNISRETVLAQLKDLFAATGESADFDLENSADAVIDKFGTVDLDKVAYDELWSTLEDSSINNSL